MLGALLPAAAGARYGASTLEVGDKGRDVKVAQKYLTKAGIRTTADGVYGRSTAATVKRFERAEDLTVDGKLDPADARALKRAAATGDTGDDDGDEAGPGGNGGASVGNTSDAPSGDTAKISADGHTATAPAGAPQEVKDAIAAANEITDKPYRYGGGHGDFDDSGYDCSGAVSYALHGADLLDAPLDSTGLESFDTSAKGEEGPRWRKEDASTDGYVVRHPEGL